MSNLPPLAVIVSHTVGSYEQWKKAFDGHQPARKAAGMLGHHLNRGADDPNLVAIYLPATDRKLVEAFLASPDLKATMKDASVTSAPSVVMLKPMEDAHIGDRPLAGLMLTAEVEDYAAWKKGYDAGAPLRARLGIIGHAVNQVLDHPNTIVVYHQAETVQALRDMLASPEVKEAMKNSGVKGMPKVELFNSPGGAAY